MPALKRVWDNYHELWRFLEEDGSYAHICFTIGHREVYTKMFRNFEAAAPEDRLLPYCTKSGARDTYMGGAVFWSYRDAEQAAKEYGAAKGQSGEYAVYGLRTRWEDGLVLYLQDDLRQFSVPWRRLAQDCEVLELDQEG